MNTEQLYICGKVEGMQYIQHMIFQMIDNSNLDNKTLKEIHKMIIMEADRLNCTLKQYPPFV